MAQQVWRDDLMKIDLRLIEVHRREANGLSKCRTGALQDSVRNVFGVWLLNQLPRCPVLCRLELRTLQTYRRHGQQAMVPGDAGCRGISGSCTSRQTKALSRISILKRSKELRTYIPQYIPYNPYSFHFLFHYPNITPIFSPYTIPIIPIVSIVFSIIPI